MISTKTNIVIEQGADFSADFTLTDANNHPLPITGYNAYAQMRKSPTANTAYNFDVTLTQGNMNLSMLSAVTSTIESGKYMYDVYFITIVGNNVIRVVEGLVNVTPEITDIP